VTVEVGIAIAIDVCVEVDVGEMMELDYFYIHLPSLGSKNHV